MNDKSIYRITELGERQLRGGHSTATAEELELLVRVDGILTVGETRAAARDDPLPDFDRLFERLIQKGLLVLREEDPFADQFSFKPSRAALKNAESDADASAASLQKHGFFVRIARTAARPVEAGAALSALVVEDDEHLSNFLKHYLEFEGFEVRSAANRAEVVAELRKTPVPDLVLLDVVLPDADGFDILIKMRQHPQLKDVPVIMLTAKATREAVLHGLASGAQGYVTKPFEADALLEAVRTVMGLPDDDAGPPAAGDPWPENKRKGG